MITSDSLLSIMGISLTSCLRSNHVASAYFVSFGRSQIYNGTKENQNCSAVLFLFALLLVEEEGDSKRERDREKEEEAERGRKRRKDVKVSGEV